MSDSARQELLQQAKKDAQTALTKFENVEKEARKKWLSDVKYRITDKSFLPWTVTNYYAYGPAKEQYKEADAKYRYIYSEVDSAAAKKEHDAREEADFHKDLAQRKKDDEALKDPDSIKDEDTN
ncbi:uncharacterized protein RHO25_011024 [Cercospora beticola]|uniref:Uncharacterized protein n=1 Tax=Cercospora beticola TaxID=122368 RepID=A0ABZ0P3E0_CERBT|nr:hypothetical protein RHO25_011024 [Cercospora beticola]